MLAELAAANAAFSKLSNKPCTNSKDIAAAGSAIAKFVGAKQDLQNASQQKRWRL